MLPPGTKRLLDHPQWERLMWRQLQSDDRASRRPGWLPGEPRRSGISAALASGSSARRAMSPSRRRRTSTAPSAAASFSPCRSKGAAPSAQFGRTAALEPGQAAFHMTTAPMEYVQDEESAVMLVQVPASRVGLYVSCLEDICAIRIECRRPNSRDAARRRPRRPGHSFDLVGAGQGGLRRRAGREPRGAWAHCFPKAVDTRASVVKTAAAQRGEIVHRHRNSPIAASIPTASPACDRHFGALSAPSLPEPTASRSPTGFASGGSTRVARGSKAPNSTRSPSTRSPCVRASPATRISAVPSRRASASRRANIAASVCAGFAEMQAS